MVPKLEIAIVFLAACGSPAAQSVGTTPRPSQPGDASVAKVAGGPVCLAGDCADGKGVETRGLGAARMVYEGTFAGGKHTGNSTIHRVAGETIESLEIDAASGTGTLRHPQFDVVGEVAEEALSDPSAAVMLPTGEWFFAEWSPGTVAVKNSNLTGSRSIPKLPGDYGDLFAGVAVLEEARHAGRELEFRPPGEVNGEPRPFTPKLVVAPFTMFMPDPKEPVAYLVGVGVVDPSSKTIAALRKGETPSGAIPILRADGMVANLEIKAGVVTRWPVWTPAVKDWQAQLATRAAAFKRSQAAIATQLATARGTASGTAIAAMRTGLLTQLAALAASITAASETVGQAVEVLPGTEADRITRLRALHQNLARTGAWVELATRLIDRTDPARAGRDDELRDTFTDVIGQIAIADLDATAFDRKP